MLDDVRECPATMALAASWVLVFALMLAVQAQLGPAPTHSSFGPLPVFSTTSQYFGHQTWAKVRGGEIWRAVTATFLHGNLIHLGLNLLGLVQLGRLIEPWYGTGPFLGICLAIGGLGNLAGGLMRQGMATLRPWVEGSPAGRLWPDVVNHVFGPVPGAGLTQPVVGGSTILLGLMGLILVVGWRSKTRMGTYLRDQMAILLFATALLGIFLPKYIDNYGHAGGALTGALIGLAHRPLLRVVERKGARRLAWASCAVLLMACMTAQARHARAEIVHARLADEVRERIGFDRTALPDLDNLYSTYGRVALRGGPDDLDELAIRDWFGLPPTSPPPGPKPEGSPDPALADRVQMKRMLDRLDRIPVNLWGDAVGGDLARLRTLGRLALDQPPSVLQAYEFAACARKVYRALLADNERSQARLMDLLRVVEDAR